MKCSYCGNQISKDEQFCPECGTIVGMDIDDIEIEDTEQEVQEQESNVFVAPEPKEEKAIPAEPVVALTFDEVEVPQVEIPKVEVTSEPIKDEFSNSGDVVEEPKTEEHTSDYGSDIYSFSDPDSKAKTNLFEETDEKTETEEGTQVEENQEIEKEETSKEIESPYKKYTDAYSIKSSREADAEADAKAAKVATSKKKRKNPIVIGMLCACVIALCVGGAYRAGFIPGYEKQTTETESQSQEDVSSTDDVEDTTDKDSTKVTDESTTDEKTTADENEAEDTTKKDNQVVVATTVKTTQNTVVTTTKKPSATSPTTKPATTAQATTQKPSTTTAKPTTTQKPTEAKPSTTQAPVATTKPASTTTDPYGIADVKVQKPNSTLSKTYTVFVLHEGVILRNKPNADSSRVLYLSKGADVTVYAKQDGFYYVRSNRYGVYGWVSTSYASTTRPEADKVIKPSGLVSPDKNYATTQTKYVSVDVGLNLRKGPAATYDVIKNLPKTYPVKVVGYSSNHDGWVYVIDTTYGVAGWVSSQYLSDSGNR